MPGEEPITESFRTGKDQPTAMAGGRIREEDIDALRERVDIVEVISDYVQLKKAGRLFKGLCPFHSEKTPSFMVDPQKQLYHCFGCGEGGNVYTFLMKKEGLDFREAVEKLAARVGFPLRYEGSREGRQEGERERLFRINEWAAELFHRLLLESPVGAPGREYLRRRGFGEEAIRAFRLGYSPPQWDFLYRRAVQKGFGLGDFIRSGLGVRSERGAYDRFRGRIIFPILDLQGRVVAFGGRVVGEGQPKYLNSPETPIYVKSRHLYGLYQARREIVQAGYALLVEGYTDVIALWQAGIGNAVATLGTALGEEHLGILSRFTEKVVLAFDADSAGLAANLRALQFGDRFNLDLRVAVLDRGSDPADFVGARGAEEFLRRVEQSEPLLDYSVRNILEGFDPRDTNSRKRGVRNVLRLLAGGGDSLVVEGQLKKVADWAGLDYAVVFQAYRSLAGKGGDRAPVMSLDADPQARVERELLGLVFHHPYLLERASLEVGEDLIIVEGHRLLWRALLEAYHSGRFRPAAVSEASNTWSVFLDGLPEEPRKLATGLIFGGSGKFDSMGKDEALLLYNGVLASLKELHIQRLIRNKRIELERLIESPLRDHEKEKEISEEIFALERMRRELRARGA